MTRRCCQNKPLFTLFLTLKDNEKEEFAVCPDHLAIIQNDYQKQFDQYEIKLAEYEERLTQYKSLGGHVPHNMTKQNQRRGDISLNIRKERPSVDLNLDFLHKNKEPLGIEAILRDSLEK